MFVLGSELDPELKVNTWFDEKAGIVLSFTDGAENALFADPKSKPDMVPFSIGWLAEAGTEKLLKVLETPACPKFIEGT